MTQLTVGAAIAKATELLIAAGMDSAKAATSAHAIVASDRFPGNIFSIRDYLDEQPVVFECQSEVLNGFLDFLLDPADCVTGNFASHFPPPCQSPWVGESCAVVVL
jgi:hypothetical protein